MKEYISVLKKYLSNNSMKLTKCRMEKVLDMLYCCYAQRTGNDNEPVRQSFAEINEILDNLSLHQQDAVIDITCDLCSNYQQAGFKDGLVIGFRLFQEILLENSLSSV